LKRTSEILPPWVSALIDILLTSCRQSPEEKTLIVDSCPAEAWLRRTCASTEVHPGVIELCSRAFPPDQHIILVLVRLPWNPPACRSRPRCLLLARRFFCPPFRPVLDYFAPGLQCLSRDGIGDHDGDFIQPGVQFRAIPSPVNSAFITVHSFAHGSLDPRQKGRLTRHLKRSILPGHENVTRPHRSHPRGRGGDLARHLHVHGQHSGPQLQPRRSRGAAATCGRGQ
jgi:hypothetical protein